MYYKLDGPLFPGSIHHGAQSETYDKTFINSSLSKSFRCNSGLRIDLGEIVINLPNFRVEPFFNKRPNLPFDDEIICTGDIVPQPSVLDQFKWVLYVIAGFLAFAILVGTCFLCCKNSEKTKKRTTDDLEQNEKLDGDDQEQYEKLEGDDQEQNEKLKADDDDDDHYRQNEGHKTNEIIVNDKCLNSKIKLVARV